MYDWASNSQESEPCKKHWQVMRNEDWKPVCVNEHVLDAVWLAFCACVVGG